MKIKSLVIKNLLAEGFKMDREQLRHIKSLPCLSVVQSLHGYYEIGIGENAPCLTEEGGAFVASAGVRQDILHHNGADGYMEAQWVFMNVVVNDLFAFEEIYELPLLIDASCGELLSTCIHTIRYSQNPCKRYEAAYRLLDLLISRSTLRQTAFDDAEIRLKRYIDKHYGQPITKEELAKVAFCSVPHLYRLFQKYFHLSPSGYINKIRLEKASVLLECCDRSVAEIAQAVGLSDAVYFSRLFRGQYGVSPRAYRRVAGTSSRE